MQRDDVVLHLRRECHASCWYAVPCQISYLHLRCVVWSRSVQLARRPTPLGGWGTSVVWTGGTND
jgi:hypothetical protein